jgi:hypothetical protein
VSPALLADALLVVHAAVVVFVVGGQVMVLVGGPLGWGWVRSLLFRVAHLVVLLVVIVQSWLGRRCPLTDWEMALRREAGQSAYGESFVAHWVGSLLFYEAPSWAFTLAYTVFGVLVLASWYWLPPRRRRPRSP